MAPEEPTDIDPAPASEAPPPTEPRVVLVTGARGYVGSRLVPALLERGHHVVATASSEPDPDRFAWGDQVEWRVLDALDPESVRKAVRGVDAVVYLLHALDQPGYEELDRRAARAMREAVDAEGVRRVVYLSGLAPDQPRALLSHHLSSRLEVEEILAEAQSASVASLRAGVVLGAGSTSFEIIRHLASTMPVQPVPSWLQTEIQPIAAVDTVRLLVHALENDDDPVGSVDIGGPDVLAYPELLAAFSRAARLLRVQLRVPSVPTVLVAQAAPLMSTAPWHTVTALVESLRFDMVCRPDRAWGLPGVRTPVDVAIREALRRRGPAVYRAQRRQRGDANWTDARVLAERIAGIGLPMPALVRSTTRLVEHRAGAVLRRLVP